MASSGLPGGRGGGLLGLPMRLEGASEGELAEPMADHVLRHVDGDELPAVVHGQGVPHELRHDGGAARPGLQHLLLALAVELLHPLLQPLVDVRPFLGRSSHGLPLLLRPARHDVAVRGARTALPREMFSWSRLPTCPTVAMHSSLTCRTSPEGSLRLA